MQQLSHETQAANLEKVYAVHAPGWGDGWLFTELTAGSIPCWVKEFLDQFPQLQDALRHQWKITDERVIEALRYSSRNCLWVPSVKSDEHLRVWQAIYRQSFQFPSSRRWAFWR